MATPSTEIKSSPHALAGKRMTGAEMIVQVLADESVDTIFGYSGGAILPTYDAVFRFNNDHRDDQGNAPMPLIVPCTCTMPSSTLSLPYRTSTSSPGSSTPSRRF